MSTVNDGQAGTARKRSPAAGKSKGGAGGKGGAAAAADAAIELRWDLATLPSAQHRAGLAGLVLMVRWLERLPPHAGVCALVDLSDSGVTLRVDRVGMMALFDATYAASEEEVGSPQVRKKKLKGGGTEVDEPLRVEETPVVDAKTGKTSVKKSYVYPVVVPSGAFLLEGDPTNDGKNGRWVKLWRDLVWGVLRGVPATRAPFEARAAKEPTVDAIDAFATLAGKSGASVKLASTYYLGAQAENADGVPFTDRAQQQFLLHFWPYTAAVYQPVEVNPRDGKRTFAGFAVVIPDVAMLESFADVYPQTLRRRGVAAAGYRPAESLIDVATEGGWDFSRRLRELVGKRVVDASSDATLGYEVHHVNKEGNNVRVYSTAHVEPVPAMIDEYTRVRGACHDAIFRRQRLLNLFASRPWHAGFDRLLQTLPYEYLLGGDSWFAKDASWSLRDSTQHNEKEGGAVTENEDEKQAATIEQIVLGLVRNYVARRVKQKTSLDWKSVKAGASSHEVRQYNEALEKVARDAFLGVRSRTGADFREYFASTLCSVPQPMGAEKYTLLTRALRDSVDEVRTLTMLALSATLPIYDGPKKES